MGIVKVALSKEILGAHLAQLLLMRCEPLDDLLPTIDNYRRNNSMGRLVVVEQVQRHVLRIEGVKLNARSLLFRQEQERGGTAVVESHICLPNFQVCLKKVVLQAFRQLFGEWQWD